MATQTDEIERKYEGPAVRPDLLADLPGVAEVLGPDPLSLEATYYDTADMRLARTGIVLRRREGGATEGWHAKLPVAAGHRQEVHVPLSRSAGSVPDELADLVRAYTLDRPLRRCAHIATRRQVWRLVDRGGDVLVEVADDSVRAQRLGEREGPVRTWHEIEVELGHDGGDLLTLVGERLVDAGATPSTADSKLSRTLGEPPRREAPRLRGRSTAAEVVTTYLRTQVEQLRAADVAIRLDEPDGVHDLRVAVRRIRSVLRVFQPILVRSRVGPVAAELKWISDLLGAARDAQVLGAQLGDAVRVVPTELVLGPVQAHIDRYLAKPAAEAMAALRAAMADQRYRGLLDALDTLLADPPFRAADRRAKDALPPLVAKAYRKARKAARSARDMAPGPDRDAALHLVRRRVKRLRYAAEAVGPVIGKPARRLRRRAKDVQGLLGEHHDLVVLRPVLRELGARAHRERANGFTFGLAHGRADDRARRLAKRFPGSWRRLSRRRSTRWLRG